MRGCLFVLLVGAAVLVGAAWLAGPPIAEGLVRGGLALTGFEAAETEVEVTTEPPVELIAGRADRVRIRATDAEVAGLRAASFDVTLTEVDLVGRTAGGVSGSLVDVRLGRNGTTFAADRIDLRGRADRADAVVFIPAESVEGLAVDALEAAVGTVPGRVSVAAPDRLSFTLAGQSVSGVLSVDEDGDLVLIAGGGLPRVHLVRAAAIVPFRATSVSVDADTVVVRGLLDVAALLR